MRTLCHCPIAAGGDRLWGTDLYTDDSNVCMAAVHAGVIGTGGGPVFLTLQPGQTSYTGTARNGISTFNYGSWGGSFHVSTWW